MDDPDWLQDYDHLAIHRLWVHILVVNRHVKPEDLPEYTECSLTQRYVDDIFVYHHYSFREVDL